MGELNNSDVAARSALGLRELGLNSNPVGKLGAKYGYLYRNGAYDMLILMMSGDFTLGSDRELASELIGRIAANAARQGIEITAHVEAVQPEPTIDIAPTADANLHT